MKKTLALLLVLALTLSIVGCSNAATATTAETATTETAATNVPVEEAKTEEIAATEVPAEESADYSDFKIAALLSGSITDSGWSASMYNAGMNLATKYGLTFDYAENITISDAEEYLRGYADMGYDIIISHGSQFADAVNAVAGDYPDTIFSITYALAYIGEHDNVIGVGYINLGYLAGIVAGCLTETDKVAMLGSTVNPSIQAGLGTFELGVKSVNPDCEVITDWIGSATDVSTAHEIAMSLINSGVDVICGYANQASLGVNQAAEEAGIYAIGCDSDQYETAPDAVVTSVVSSFIPVYEDIFNLIVSGQIEPKAYGYGIASGGVYLSDWHGWDEKLPADKVTQIKETIQGIIDGTISEPEPQTFPDK